MPDLDYEAHKEQAAARQKEQATKGRDIGPIPPVENVERREFGGRSLRNFLETYFPATFCLGWSPDHIAFLEDVENVIKRGGRKAVFMARGSGKTSTLLRAPNYGLCYGHRKFIALIGPEETAAKDCLSVIKAEWEDNPLLLADFPEIAFPIRCLEGINNRATGQTCMGDRTKIQWTDTRIQFPSIAGSPAAGAMISVAGLTGRIRGLQYKDMLTGETRRPDCVLIDDFQTDMTALSDVQCSKRESILNGAVMGLAGPGKSLSCFVSSTIIRHGDTASRVSNRDLYPRWRTDLFKLVYKWPEGKVAEEHWERYLEIRAAELADGIEEHPDATAYYRKHKKAMDGDSKVGWERRKLPHELSAIQHAYGLRADNVATFDAEYQNDPKDVAAEAVDLVLATADKIVLKQGAHRRGDAPEFATNVFAGVDVQGESLWWVIVGVGEDFSGAIIDRGVWPDQKKLGLYFTNDDVKQRGTTMSAVTGEDEPEAALYVGLETLAAKLFSRKFKKPTGEVLRLERCMIDDGHMSRIVRNFCRASSLAVMPCKGEGVTAKKIPWSRQRKKPGERRGPGWKMPPVLRTDEIRHVLIDTNDWATRMMRRWTTSMGGKACWSLYKAPHLVHRMLADQICSESPTQTHGHGRELYEWKLKVGAENHWNDAIRMAAVGASIAGIDVPGEKVTAKGAAENGGSGGRAVGGGRKPAVHRKPQGRQQRPKKSMAERKAELEARRANQGR